MVRKCGEVDVQLLAQAMNVYFGSPGKNLSLLARYDRAMGITAELKTYLEVLS